MPLSFSVVAGPAARLLVRGRRLTNSVPPHEAIVGAMCQRRRRYRENGRPDGDKAGVGLALEMAEFDQHLFQAA